MFYLNISAPNCIQVKAPLILADPRCLFWFDWGKQERLILQGPNVVGRWAFSFSGPHRCLYLSIFQLVWVAWRFPSVDGGQSQNCQMNSVSPLLLLQHLEKWSTANFSNWYVLVPLGQDNQCLGPHVAHGKHSHPQPKQMISEQQRTPHWWSTVCLPVLSRAFLRHESDANSQCPLLFRGCTQIST